MGAMDPAAVLATMGEDEAPVEETTSTSADDGSEAAGGEEEETTETQDGGEEAAGGEDSGEEAGAGDEGGEEEAGEEADPEKELGMDADELSLEAEMYGGDKAKLLKSVQTTLGEMYAQHPKLKEFLNDPEVKASGLRNMFFRAKVLNDTFPTVYHAKEAAQKAGDLDQFDNFYYSDDPKDSVALVLSMKKASSADGQETGAFERHQKAVIGDALADLFDRAEKDPDKFKRETGIDPTQIRVATLLFGKALKLDGYALPKIALKMPTAGPKDETPEQKSLREREERIAQREKDAEERNQQGAATLNQQYQAGITAKFTEWMGKEAEGQVAKMTALAGKEKSGIRSLATEAITTRARAIILKDSKLQADIKGQLKSAGRRPEIAEKILRDLKWRSRSALAKAASEVGKLLGQPMMVAQTDAEKRQKAGESRRDPASGAAPGKPTGGAARPKPGAAARQASGNYQAEGMRMMEEALKG